MRQRLAAMPRPEVVFNYLGQLDAALSAESWLRPAPESPGPGRSPRQPRAHLLEINASIVAGRLEAVWTWGTEIHRRATVERLAAGFLARLRELLALGRSEGAAGFTPSDFPEMGFVQDDLDDLLADLDRTIREGER
ncbi:MAG TPA: hypothetical protein VEW48_11920 [Thermoanaerobaculia bacterium]|nr:hypothetical protein [Thermoanaerobaculia bacterium]